MSAIAISISKMNLKPGEAVVLSSAAILGVLSWFYPDRALFTEKRDIPNGKSYPIVGALPFIVAHKNKIHDLFRTGFSMTNTLNICNSVIGLPTIIITIDPRNIEHVLKYNFENYVKGPMLFDATEEVLGHGIFTSNGEAWKYQRKAASLIFNVRNFRDHFTALFIEHIDIAGKYHFDQAAERGSIVDFQDVMFRFTLDSFVKLGFGVSVGALQTKGKVAFAEAFDYSQRNSYERFINPAFKVTETLATLMMPWRRSPSYYFKVMDDFAYKIIRQRRQELSEGKEFKDLLSRFMTTKNESNESLNDEELRDVVMNFIIAGRDTTAQTLSWCFYCLMQHPRVEQKLLTEINALMTDEAEADPAVLHDVIKNMKYAHAVLYETLRLHGPVPANQKMALEDDVWPDGTLVKKNDYVMWSGWAQAREPRVWGVDCHDFRPERWLNQEGDLIRESQGKFIAFHAGPRVCLGQNLATLEALVAIVYFLRRYRFTLVPGYKVEYFASLTMPIKDGLRVQVERRSSPS
ncbi:cytochrome P450 [Hesseltinella vesiculosa]|uniref:Cytochrome P450 n=1 Tax=Hesseltinella vesiculosa TaxID=101127 RepID=A0A1X2GC34_9FUNG|nr:cytochrome P450 [Hesseltinella vesiculosa]